MKSRWKRRSKSGTNPETDTRPSATARPAEGMRLCLSVFEGPDAGTTVAIDSGRVVIGRKQGDLRLSDPAVVDPHCTLEIFGAEARLQDHGAGTRVNGAKVLQVALHDRDEIRIGSTGIVFTAVKDVDVDFQEPAVADAGEGSPEGSPETRTDPTRTRLDGVPYRPKPGVRGHVAVLLEVVKGSEAGRVFDLSTPGVYIIGRMNGEVALEDSKCSRKHAQVEVLGQGEYFVSDLASTNGTFLNETRTTRRRLKHLDIVRIGRTELRFSCQENAIPVSS